MRQVAYYNEFDPKAAVWLRELIKEGLIAHGEVDERSIIDVSASDLRGFRQHHFFAGVAGWSYALRLAGWSDDVGVWTASLPCQPFSAAGKGLGKSDERHLLPHFIELVKECKPSVLLGEQVSAAIKHGWLDDLYAEMEACDYAVGSIIIGAHSIGAPHIRQRLYWVADNCSERLKKQSSNSRIPQKTYGNVARENSIGSSGMGDTESYDKLRLRELGSGNGQQEPSGGSGVFIRMGDTEHDGRITSQVKRSDGSTIRHCETRPDSTSELEGASASESLSWIYCRDNKYRPIKPGIQPLVDVVPKGMVRGGDTSAPINANATQEARAMRLKGYGNAIVPTLAAEFIRAYMSCK